MKKQEKRDFFLEQLIEKSRSATLMRLHAIGSFYGISRRQNLTTYFIFLCLI